MSKFLGNIIALGIFTLSTVAAADIVCESPADATKMLRVFTRGDSAYLQFFELNAVGTINQVIKEMQEHVKDKKLTTVKFDAYVKDYAFLTLGGGKHIPFKKWGSSAAAAADHRAHGGDDAEYEKILASVGALSLKPMFSIGSTNYAFARG